MPPLLFIHNIKFIGKINNKKDRATPKLIARFKGGFGLLFLTSN